MTRARSFRQRFPNVELDFSEREPEDSVPGLRRGDFDFVVVFDYPNFPLEFDRDIDAELIFEDRWVALRLATPCGGEVGADRGPRRRGLALWRRPSSCRTQVLKLGREAGFEPRISFQRGLRRAQGIRRGGLGSRSSPSCGWITRRSSSARIGGEADGRVWAVTRETESRPPAAELHARHPP